MRATAIVADKWRDDMVPLRMRLLPVLAGSVVLVTACASPGNPSDARYEGFSAEAASISLADLPQGWSVVPRESVPPEVMMIKRDVVDSEERWFQKGSPADGHQIIGVGIALGPSDASVGRADEIAEALGDAGAEDIRITEYGIPKVGSQKVSYRYGEFVDDEVRFVEGRVLAQIGILYPLGVTPDVELDDLAQIVYERITGQLHEP